jgi:hypothetical protein
LITKYDDILSSGGPENIERNIRRIKALLHPDRRGNDEEFKQFVDVCEEYIRDYYSRPYEQMRREQEERQMRREQEERRMRQEEEERRLRENREQRLREKREQRLRENREQLAKEREEQQQMLREREERYRREQLSREREQKREEKEESRWNRYTDESLDDLQKQLTRLRRERDTTKKMKYRSREFGRYYQPEERMVEEIEVLEEQIRQQYEIMKTIQDDDEYSLQTQVIRALEDELTVLRRQYEDREEAFSVESSNPILRTFGRIQRRSPQIGRRAYEDIKTLARRSLEDLYCKGKSALCYKKSSDKKWSGRRHTSRRR